MVNKEERYGSCSGLPVSAGNYLYASVPEVVSDLVGDFRWVGNLVEALH